MTGNTFNGVLTVKFDVKENYYSFIRPGRMIEKVRHRRQDEYKQCDSDVESEQ